MKCNEKNYLLFKTEDQLNYDNDLEYSVIYCYKFEILKY